MSAGAEGRPRRVGEDVVVALHRPAELLSVEPEAMLERDARIEPGADEIVNELLGRSKVQRRARIVVTLPAEQSPLVLPRPCTPRFDGTARRGWRGFSVRPR